MATYSFRFGFVGFFQNPSTWYNQTAGAVATLSPGLGDSILLNAPGGDLRGDGSVDQVTLAAPPGATAFNIGGTISTRGFSQSSALALSTGAILNLLGRPNTTAPQSLNAATTLTNATLAVSGALAIANGNLAAVQNSTVTTTSLTLGTTAALGLNNSTLTLSGSGDNALTAAGPTAAAAARIALSNNAALSIATLSVGSTGYADLTATSGSTITTNTLSLGQSGTATATLSAATLNVAQSITVADAGTATLSMAGGTLGAQALLIGNASTGRGTVSLSAGANVQLQSSLQLAPAGTAALSLTGAGTFLTSPLIATIGQAGAATLALAAGAQLQLPGLNAATATTGTATISVDGANTRLMLAGPTFLGPAGSANLALSNAATVSAQDLFLGNARVSIATTAALTANQINGGPQTSLSLSNAGSLTAASLTLTGTLTLSTNSVATVSTASLAALTLGTGATFKASTLALTAPLSISGGASLTADTLTTTGSIYLTGPGTHLTLSNPTTAPITLTQGAILSLPSNALGATTPILDGTSLVTIGAGASLFGAGYNVAPNASLTLTGKTIAARITNSGIVTASNATLAAAAGPGIYQIGTGTLDIASFAGSATFTAQFATLRLRSLSGPVTITNIQPGEIIDLPGQFGSFSGSTLTIGGNALTLAFNPNTAFRLDVLPTGDRITTYDPLFDATYYLAHNPDVAAAGVDPYQHFTVIGWQQNRDPSALFSLNYYTQTYPGGVGQNPFQLFEQSGLQAGRNPDPYFNPSYYLSQNPDVAAAGINPLLHYQTDGWRQGRNPSAQFSLADNRAAYGPSATDPLARFLTTGAKAGQRALAVGPTPERGFDAAYYYAHNPDVLAAGQDAMQHYLSFGAAQGRAPNAIFDTNLYRTLYADAGSDPLAQYVQSGAASSRDPSLLFSVNSYLIANPDVAAAQIDPVLHYIEYGQFEGRPTYLAGPSRPGDLLVQSNFYDHQLGATLIPTGYGAEQQAAASYDTYGWQRGLNPDAYFDTAYYLAHNPDVAAAHINPLIHYEQWGWKEGRNPSAAFDTRAYQTAYPDVKAAGLDPLVHFIEWGIDGGRQAFPVHT